MVSRLGDSLFSGAVVGLAVCALACSQSEASSVPSPDGDSGRGDADSAVFSEMAAEVGLDFVHDNGAAGEYHMAEVSGSGVALFDYDNDGDLDAYFVQSGALPGRGSGDGGRGDRLYRNELISAERSGEARSEDRSGVQFVDVSGQSGTLGTGYGMAVAVGDYDNDGWRDLYLTALDGDQLLRNRGDGTFEDVTREAGIDHEHWTVPAAFVDYDSDGWLDLFVGGYLAVGSEAPRCTDSTGAPDYCGPEDFVAVADRILRNQRDGTFSDVTAELELEGDGPALGIVTVDLDGDGQLELYVANDGRPNHQWHFEGREVRDRALLSGSAINAQGRAEASMGVDAADFDRDGDFDLFMTHLISETNTLYRNDGSGAFSDQTNVVRLATASRLRTSFGTGFLDYDNDGWLDLLVVNGAVRKIEALARAGDEFPFEEPNQLFRNRDGGTFADVTLSAGEAFLVAEVSRGAAFGDVDNDGDVDVLISNNGGPARLLVNGVGARSSWVGIELLEQLQNGVLRSFGIDGAGVELVAGDMTQLKRVRVNGSYASSSDPRLIFGLGSADAEGFEAHVRVTLRDGSQAELGPIERGRYNRFVFDPVSGQWSVSGARR